MKNDLRYFEYPYKPLTQRLRASICFTACFNISKDIGISLLFFMTFVSCFVVLLLDF